MIDQSLVNHVESYILNGENLPVHVSENILDAYISLIEQNAELHKELAKFKARTDSNIKEGKPYSETPPSNLAM